MHPLNDTVSGFSFKSQEIENFHRQGYCGPFTLYQPEEMRATWKRVRLALFDRSMAAYNDGEEGTGNINVANYDRHLDVDVLSDHICRSEIVGRLSSILGPDVLCWRSEFFPKQPGDEGTDWHQADTFASASGQPQLVWPTQADFGGTITVWTAFTETNEETACLRFIPGTHRTMYYDETKKMHYDPSRINQVERDGERRGFFGYDYRQLQKDPNWKPDESRSVSIPMHAGQFIMFWSTLMHASHPHRGKTKEMRIGYAARYVPTGVKVYPDTETVSEYGGTISLQRYGAVLVAGEDRFGHNRIATSTTRGKPFTRRVSLVAA